MVVLDFPGHGVQRSSLRFKCNGLLHLNRGLPGSAVFDLGTVRHFRSKIRLSCFQKGHSDVPGCKTPSLPVQRLRPTRT
jgi:hypothetical protein